MPRSARALLRPSAEATSPRPALSLAVPTVLVLARFGLLVGALAVQLFLLPEAEPGLQVLSTAFPLPLLVHRAAARLCPESPPICYYKF